MRSESARVQEVNNKDAKAAAIHFRTIGLGSINYRLASKRLANEIRSTGFFASSAGLTESYLKNQCAVFWKQHRKILKPHILGFGYWAWKAELIRTLLHQIPEDEILLYMDAGSFVDTRTEMRGELASLIDSISKSDFGGSSDQKYLEKEFCSEDLMNLLGLESSARDSNQFFGGFIFIRNNATGRSIANQWAELTCFENHRYLVPTHFNRLNDLNFVHHAYDQAIISCLFKKYEGARVTVGDRANPGIIRLVRHRLATRYENPNALAKLLFQGIATLSRLKNATLRRVTHSRTSVQGIPKHF